MSRPLDRLKKTEEARYMVFVNKLPSILEGITAQALRVGPAGMSFKWNYYLPEIYNLLGRNNVSDPYVYMVGITPAQFKAYYEEVIITANRIDFLFRQGDKEVLKGVRGVVCPKVMFLFDNMRSCEIFKERFEAERELLRREAVVFRFASNSSAVAVLSKVDHPGCQVC